MAVLWDLDGVLVDTEGLLYEAERVAFAEHGVVLTPEAKRPFVGMGGHEVLAAMVAALGVDVDVRVVAARKLEVFRELTPSLRGFAPTAAMVRALAAAGVPQAVASGNSREGITAALRVVGLDDVLTVQVSADEVVAGKPAPDVFLEAAGRLGVPPSVCTVVEDAVPGVLAAAAAGMRCLAIPGVTDPWDERFAAADLVVAGGMDTVGPQALVRWLLDGHARP